MTAGRDSPVLRRPRLTGPVLAACLLGAVPAGAQRPPAEDPRMPTAPVHEEVLTLRGDPARPVALQVTLFTPDAPGPFPLAVMNHGATSASVSNRGERYRTTAAAFYFLSRGYAVALPMLRGFAGSGGTIPGKGCDMAEVARLNARDIAAVIEQVGARAVIDRTRIVAAGQSYGGWNVLGLAAAPPPGLRGVVAFNPAIRNSDCGQQDAAMEAGAAALGRQAAVPSLWFYGDNDLMMPVPVWRAVHGGYTGAGGRAELVAFGRYGADSHQLLSVPRSMAVWAPEVDAFLGRIGLPNRAAYPGYLPQPAPPPTGFAALRDVAAVPYLSDADRAAYARFLAAERPRAFAIAPDAAAAMASGGYDPVGYALRGCARTSARCRLYAVDDEVVWTGPTREEAETQPNQVVSRSVPAEVPTPLGGAYTVTAGCASRGLSTITVVAQPAHGGVTAGPREETVAFPPGHAFARCNGTRVQAMGITYTPAPGYTGPDSFTFRETNADGRRQVVRIDVMVR